MADINLYVMLDIFRELCLRSRDLDVWVVWDCLGVWVEVGFVRFCRGLVGGLGRNFSGFGLRSSSGLILDHFLFG